MKILFLDQSGKPGGAELFLVDLAKHYGDRCRVILFTAGVVESLLNQHKVPVQILNLSKIEVRKQSNIVRGLIGFFFFLPPLFKLAKLARSYDVIYANTPKALIAGAVLSLLCRRPLIYHLHDILSTDHFSDINRRIIVTLANRFCSLVIANSQAAQVSFANSGGCPSLTKIVYNGFEPESYQVSSEQVDSLKEQFNLTQKFVVGHFSRLSPWKGQHILIEALAHCPEDVVAILVGDALFGEDNYVKQLHQQVARLGLEKRVKFLGFRQDVPKLMAACEVVTHTSTAPEPFGRVIVEAMLVGRPIIASKAGGAVELVEPGETGWLCPPGDVEKLAELILLCRNQPEFARLVAQKAQTLAAQKFLLDEINQQVDHLIHQAVVMNSGSNLANQNLQSLRTTQ
jgi:glycosyltransferase involved in cell wall biosynthesis